MQQPKQTPQSERRIKIGAKEKPARVDTVRIHDTVTIERLRIDTVPAFAFTLRDTIVLRDTVRDSTCKSSIIPLPIPIPLTRGEQQAPSGSIPTTATPEPDTIVLVMLGLCIIVVLARWRR